MLNQCTRLLVLLVFLPMLGFGQVAYQLSPVPHQQFFDANGKPLAGGFVYTYSAGSSTPLATYKDNIGTANTNPIVLDAGGFATIYLGQNSYKFCVQNSSAVQQWCQDNVQNISQVLLTTANTWSLGQTFNSLINFLGGTSDTTAAEGNVFYRTDLHRLRWYDANTAAWHSVIGHDTTDTLSNKTLTAPTITGTTTTSGQIVSSLATGTAPFSVSSTTPVANLAATPTMYNTAGSQIPTAHLVRIDSMAMTAGSFAVTLTGSAAFTALNTYRCSITDETAANAIKLTYTSGSAFTITGTGTDTVSGVCVGN